MLTFWMNASGSLHQCDAPESLRLPGEKDADFLTRVVVPMLPNGLRQVQDPQGLWGTVMTGLLTVDAAGNLHLDAAKQQFLNSKDPVAHGVVVFT